MRGLAQSVSWGKNGHSIKNEVEVWGGNVCFVGKIIALKYGVKDREWLEGKESRSTSRVGQWCGMIFCTMDVSCKVGTSMAKS